MPEIIIKDLLVKYYIKKKEQVTAINKTSAVFKSEKISVILGESGCGKSTLLKTISGLLDFEGDVLVDGQDYSQVTYDKRSLAFMDQNILLFPKMTIYDNIMFPLNSRKMTREEIDIKVKTLAKTFGILHCLSRLPKQISIGQAQRAFLAKTLIRDPKIVLFDEPLSSSDPLIRSEILNYLKSYIKENKTTVIYVTHNIKEAYAIADEIFVMKDGVIIDKGTPNEILKSTNAETTELVEKGLIDETN